jgi:surface antigen
VNDGTVTSVAVPLRRLGAPNAATATPAPIRRPSRLRKPLKAAVALVAIPGMFLTAALPAYAFAPNGEVAGGASASRILTTTEAQAMTVAAGATLTVARDGYTATTKEELEERERQAKRAAEVQRAAEAAAARASASASSPGKYAVRGVRAEGDDYPWPYATTDDDGGGLSPLGYYYRECVDFVAWRLNRDAGSTGSPWTWTWGNMTPGGGSASSWKNQWDRHGWATSDTPVVGAVAWFTYNHVAYVQSIPGDGTVVLEEYNWMGSHAYHTRTVSIGSVAKYLYPPS